MSEKVSSADNQQGSYLVSNPSETTRRSPIVLSKKEIHAYLLGAMHDGSLNKNKRIRIGQKYPEWLNTIKNLLEVLNVHSWIYKEGNDRDYYILETVYKNLSFSFNPNELTTNNEKVAYIRGFFDAEGGIPRNNGKFYIQLVQKNLQKIKILREFLVNMGINCGIIHNPSKRVDPNYWRFFVSTDSHKEFAKIIGSWHPIKSKIFSQRMMI